MKISKILDVLKVPENYNEVYSPSNDSYLFLDFIDTSEFKMIFFEWLAERIQHSKRNFISVLDMGCGSGILGYVLILKLLDLILESINSEMPNFQTIILDYIDINEKAINLARELVRQNEQLLADHFAKFMENKKKISVQVNFFVSNLFKSHNVRLTYPYDYVIFNPPYLPSEPAIINENNRKIIDYAWDGGDDSGNAIILDFFSNLDDKINKHSQIFFISSSHAQLDVLVKSLEEMGYLIELKQSIHIFFEDIMLFQAKKPSSSL
ncbi:MAG: hypothetical protein GF364_04320 [Candidatus Lokiarchaeota archaeon]|nr:hypothetical protein [Candidatus Lokiarchaeota archaeon]